MEHTAQPMTAPVLSIEEYLAAHIFELEFADFIRKDGSPRAAKMLKATHSPSPFPGNYHKASYFKLAKDDGVWRVYVEGLDDYYCSKDHNTREEAEASYNELDLLVPFALGDLAEFGYDY